ncbi:MAG: sulfatase [Candidatus Omnitrophota bacterium]
MPNRPKQTPKTFLRPWFVWMFLSALAALVEYDIAAMSSRAFSQYLRDLPLFSLYLDLLGVFLIYAAVGALGRCMAWGVARLRGKEGESFLVKNGVALFSALAIFIYGFWGLRKFFYLKGILSWLGLAAASGGVLIFAGFLGCTFQRIFTGRKARECAALLILVTLAIPPILRLVPPDMASASGVPNVILLSVDTLRPDHLGSLGYKNAKTPNVNRLVSEGFLFRQAYAQIPLTGPSFTSILTGLYPKTHGCRQNLSVLDPSFVTLAEAFKNLGYRTAAFVSGYPLKQELCGLSNGFYLYQDRFSFFDGFKLLRFLERFGFVELQLERRAEMVSRLAIPWMRRYKKDSLFVWIHYYDPHVPYRPPLLYSKENMKLRQETRHQRYWWGKGKEAVSPEAVGAMTALYDAEITYVDQDIGRILSFLEREGLKKETLIVFVSDHGESFDHDYYFDHGDRLYESCIRVPLALVYPGVVPKGVVTDEIVESVDIFPTVFSILKLPTRDVDGKDLFVKLLSKTIPQAYSELSRRGSCSTFGDLWSVRQGPWKLIYSPEGRPPELYHLGKDPGESVNLSSTEAERTKRMTEQLIQWMRPEGKESLPRPVGGLDREKLRSLGYLQ